MTVILFALFCLLQTLDVVLTLKVLRQGGRELNPIMVWAIKQVGAEKALIVTKLALVGIVYLSPLSIVVLVVLDLIYLGVVGWNCKELYGSVGE